jgi:hypothetical protein
MSNSAVQSSDSSKDTNHANNHFSENHNTNSPVNVLSMQDDSSVLYPITSQFGLHYNSLIHTIPYYPGRNRRVKLYQLNTQGNWQDRGTAFVSFILTLVENIQALKVNNDSNPASPTKSNSPPSNPTAQSNSTERIQTPDLTELSLGSDNESMNDTLEESNSANNELPSNYTFEPSIWQLCDNNLNLHYCLELLVHAEQNDNALLIRHAVSNKIDYQKQGDSIISWCDTDTAQDLALSFQETARCLETQEIIAKSQMGKIKLSLLAAEEGNNSNNSNNVSNAIDGYQLEQVLTKRTELLNSLNSLQAFEDPESSELPPVDPRYFPLILSKLCSISSNKFRSSIIEQILGSGSNCDYIAQLFKLFEASESEKNLEILHRLFEIIVSVIMLNDLTILEFLLYDELNKTIQLLEYDPNIVKTIEEGNFPVRKHVNCLKNSKFKLICPYEDNYIITRIRENYKLSYIRDVILLRYLEDQTTATFNSMIYVNTLSIISKLNENKAFWHRLFDQMKKACNIDNSAHSPLTGSPSIHSNNNNHNNNNSAAKPKYLIQTEYELNSGANNNNSALHDYPTRPISPTDAKLHTLNHNLTNNNNSPLMNRKRGRDHLAESWENDDSLSTVLSLSSNNTTSSSTLDELNGELVFIESNRADYSQQLFLFLQELVNMAKNIALAQRDTLFRCMINKGLLVILEHELVQSYHQRAATNCWLWNICTDILLVLLTHDADLLRDYLTEKFESAVENKATAEKSRSSSANLNSDSDGEDNLLSCLFGVLTSDSIDSGCAHQLNQIIKLLLEMEPLNASIAAASYKLLHDTVMQQPDMLESLVKSLSLNNSKANTIHFHCLDLLAFSAPRFSQFKPFALRTHLILNLNNFLEKARRPELVIAAIRLIKAIFSSNDMRIQSAALECQLLDTVIKVFNTNGNRYNLLNSCILDLFNHIRATNLERIIEYCCEKYDELFTSIKYVDTFQELIYKYQSNKQPPAEHNTKQNNSAAKNRVNRIPVPQSELSREVAASLAIEEELAAKSNHSNIFTNLHRNKNNASNNVGVDFDSIEAEEHSAERNIESSNSSNYLSLPSNSAISASIPVIKSPPMPCSIPPMVDELDDSALLLSSNPVNSVILHHNIHPHHHSNVNNAHHSPSPTPAAAASAHAHSPDSDNKRRKITVGNSPDISPSISSIP